MTVGLFAVNVIVFFAFFIDGPRNEFQASLLTDQSLLQTGRIYYEYIQNEKNNHELLSWSKTLSPQNKIQMQMLASVALRDYLFLEASSELQIEGDQVELASWKKNISEFMKNYKNENLYVLGLGHKNKKFWTWLTYQFSHASIMHILSNMVFLLSLGLIVETLIGSYWFLFIYIMGGFCGGLAYLMGASSSFVPMVGASASISSVLAFYAIYEIRKNIRYFYFFSPFQGHFGMIYLTPLLIIPLYILADISQVLSTPILGANGGVAHSAHAGGALFGIIAGLLFRYVFNFKKISWRTTRHEVQIPDEEYFP